MRIRCSHRPAALALQAQQISQLHQRHGMSAIQQMQRRTTVPKASLPCVMPRMVCVGRYIDLVSLTSRGGGPEQVKSTVACTASRKSSLLSLVSTPGLARCSAYLDWRMKQKRGMCARGQRSTLETAQAFTGASSNMSQDTQAYAKPADPCSHVHFPG